MTKLRSNSVSLVKFEPSQQMRTFQCFRAKSRQSEMLECIFIKFPLQSAMSLPGNLHVDKTSSKAPNFTPSAKSDKLFTVIFFYFNYMAHHFRK